MTHQADLFQPPPHIMQNKLEGGDHAPRYLPLAARFRPQTLDTLVGNPQLLGPEASFRKLLAKNAFGSLLLYGPPGSGKTTLARVIAKETNAHFVCLNAVSSNVSEVRDQLKMARYRTQQDTILFIDEIHRFNKAQQDLLLPDVEEGNIRLIGATTHNPRIYVNPPLLSRSHLIELKPLSKEEIATVLDQALSDPQRGLGNHRVQAPKEVLLKIADLCGSDLRRALNILETLALSLPTNSQMSESDLENFALERHLRYDKDEDEHYDSISAFIKSIRGCDPDAALYWLAKMLEGGEDPRFIARRLIILASEDVGLADSRGLPLATACFDACETIGMPECSLNLAHTTVFLATAPKSNSAYLAFKEAQKAIREEPLQAIPPYLKSKPVMGKGQEAYLYSHDYPQCISGQNYMIAPKTFYIPKNVGAESAIAERHRAVKLIKNNQTH